MAFVQQTPRIFNRASIEALSLNLTGVYGLYRPGQWIYVGKGNIRERLFAHLNGDNSRITAQRPTHFVLEMAVDPLMSAREKHLILALDPICNKQVASRLYG